MVCRAAGRTFFGTGCERGRSMGFGFLLLGYLASFLLEAAVKSLGFGAAVQILGYLLMGYGVSRLAEYQKEFRRAQIGLALLILIAIPRLILDLNSLFLWGIVWEIDELLNWGYLAAFLIFHTLLLPAILRLASAVGLPKTANASSRNLILVWLWGVLYLIRNLIPMSEQALRVLNPVLLGFQLLAILMNAFLFLSCMKNICPEGEEDPAPHRYKLNFLNRIGDKFSELQENAAKKKRGEIEDYLRRRKEKRERKAREKQNRK